MFTSRFRIILALTLIGIMTLDTSSSFARGGRGGGGRGAGARPTAGARPSSPPSGKNITKNLGGMTGNPGNKLPGNQKLPSTLQQAGQGRLPQTLNNLPGSQNLQSTFQQQIGKFGGQAQGQFNGQAQQSAKDRAQQFQSGPDTFSPSWYASHPQAWQYTHPHADAAAVATAAGVAAWMGAAYYTPNDSSGGSTTVVYQAAPVEEQITEGSLPTQVTANVVADTAAWMPVGTYSLAVNQNTPPTLMLQLAVDHTGELRGVYYDSLTNTTQNIVGVLDPATQIASWSLESNQQLSFQTSLNELLKPTSSVQVNLATGPQQWQMVRVEQN